MPRAYRVCSVSGCPELVKAGRCAEHRRAADRARGTAAERGYAGKLWRSRRRQCLKRDPSCTCAETNHQHSAPCGDPATVADHYPLSRRELLAAGVTDPDTIDRLRGLCASCHSRATATTPGQQGGWNTGPSR